MTMTSSDAAEVLDREFLTIRGRLLEVAAGLDRVERAAGSVAADPRWQGLLKAAEMLTQKGHTRVGALQMLLSLPYDEDWRSWAG